MPVRVEGIESTGGTRRGLQRLTAIEMAVKSEGSVGSDRRETAITYADRAVDLATEVAEVFGQPVTIFRANSEGCEVGLQTSAALSASVEPSIDRVALGDNSSLTRDSVDNTQRKKGKAPKRSGINDAVLAKDRRHSDNLSIFTGTRGHTVFESGRPVNVKSEKDGIQEVSRKKKHTKRNGSSR